MKWPWYSPPGPASLLPPAREQEFPGPPARAGMGGTLSLKEQWRVPAPNTHCTLAGQGCGLRVSPWSAPEWCLRSGPCGGRAEAQPPTSSQGPSVALKGGCYVPPWSGRRGEGLTSGVWPGMVSLVGDLGGHQAPARGGCAILHSPAAIPGCQGLCSPASLPKGALQRAGGPSPQRHTVFRHGEKECFQVSWGPSSESS